jgi:hypothetical protein
MSNQIRIPLPGDKFTIFQDNGFDANPEVFTVTLVELEAGGWFRCKNGTGNEITRPWGLMRSERSFDMFPIA